MHSFYNLPKAIVWTVSILLFAMAFLPVILFDIGNIPTFLLLGLLTLYLPVLQFSMTPFLRMIGIYQYYSPFLLGYAPTKTKIDLHGGTSFDLLFIMRGVKAGWPWRRKLLLHLLDGLIELTNRIESQKISGTVTIVGTSYFFSSRTMLKLGFSLAKPSLMYRLNLLFNFIDVTWMYSVSEGKFLFPKLWDAKKAFITGNDLVSKKAALLYLRNSVLMRRDFVA